MSRMNKSAVTKLERVVLAGRGKGSATKSKLLEKLASAADMAASCVEEALSLLDMHIVQDKRDELWKVVGNTPAANAA